MTKPTGRAIGGKARADKLTPERRSEIARIEELKERRLDATAEINRIYERCRKRMERRK